MDSLTDDGKKPAGWHRWRRRQGQAAAGRQAGQESQTTGQESYPGQEHQPGQESHPGQEHQAGQESRPGKRSISEKNSRIITILLCLALLTGIGLLLYPTVSDYYNSLHQSSAIVNYAESLSDLDEETIAAMWEAAVSYNEALLAENYGLTLPAEAVEEYESLLDVNGSGMMGYIEIPKISVYLPIYHGTDDKILARNIGHIDGSSLPVGGEGTHCVLSGHRGLTSAKLFTNLDKLSEGDIFILHILDQDLTYEVDQILTVLPNEVSALNIVSGEDYCTLVTCTPYGINTHRLLVRGRRVNEDDGIVVVTGDAFKLDSAVIAPVVAAPILLVLLILLLWTTRKKRDTAAAVRELAGRNLENMDNTD